MSDAEYAFLTTWRIDAPLAAVWEAVYHVERWPSWWRALEQAEEIAPGDTQRVGYTCRLTWKGVLPYRLIVQMRAVRVEPPALLESLASGELEGRGIWRLSPRDGGTTAQYDWRVRTTTRWMNRLAPLARPFFAWNHDIVMRQGEAGLKRLLEPPR